MPRVSIDTPAPEFTLEDFLGERINLSNFKGQFNILLIFNRGLT